VSGVLKVTACAGVLALMTSFTAGTVFAGQGGVPNDNATNHSGNGAGSANAHGGNESANPAATSNQKSQDNKGVPGNDRGGGIIVG